MIVKSSKVIEKYRGDQLPDIDLDFPTQRRNEVKKYIIDKYGIDFACSVSTFSRMKLKTCLKDFAKVKGLPFDLMNKLTKDIDDQVEYTWGDLFNYASQSKRLFKFVQEHPDLVMLTKHALLQPKAASVHPSAMIIVPRVDDHGNEMNIFSWLPIKEVDGELVSEWEGKYIDKGGYLKEDILGLSQLDKFKEIIELIKENHGVDIIVNDIPFDDQEVYRYFRRGWCEDVFQFGTAGLMNYCKMVKPDNLEQLIAMTALFRPGAMQSNAHQDFADIKNGKKKPKYDYGMEKITENTLSLYAYQEQIMQAVIVGGLTPVESDILRTTIKKKDFKTLNSYGEKFMTGYSKLLKDNKVFPNDEIHDEAKKVWDKLLAFSGYGFNKSHAAAYSIISYWSQWFKVNYPLEFWTVSLNNSKESEIPFRLAEMKKTGVDIEVRPPDVNLSDIHFTCNKVEKQIFFSLSKVKGCGDVATQNILNTRKEHGKFYSMEDFIDVVPSKVNKTVIERLIISGGFDIVENINQPKDRKKLLKKFLESRGVELPEQYKTDDAKENSFWISEQKLLTGFGEINYESMLENAITNKRILKNYIDAFGFQQAKEGTEATIAGKLIYYDERKIKSGTMAALKIECNNELIVFLLWPDMYEYLNEDWAKIKGKHIAINGIVKKYKENKTVNSNDRTRLFIIQ